MSAVLRCLALASLLVASACVDPSVDLSAPPGAPAPLLQGAGTSSPQYAAAGSDSGPACSPVNKLERSASAFSVDGVSVAAPSGARVGTGAPPSGPFYERIKGCAPRSRDAAPKSYALGVAAGVAYDDAAAVMETASFGGFGLVTLDGAGGPLVLRVLPVGAKGMQVSLMDDIAQPKNPDADPDEAKPSPQAVFGEVRRPIQVLLLRIDNKQIEAVWADQLADDPIVKRLIGDAKKPDALAAQLKQACHSPSITCDRVVVESDHSVGFDRVRQVLVAVGNARPKREPLKTEFVLLDAGSTASERAALRIGVPLESGKLAKDAVDDVVHANYGRINACYKAALKKDPALHGRFVVRFVVDLHGETRDIADAKDPDELTGADASGAPGGGAKKEPALSEPGVVSCILDVFRSLKFAAPAGGTVKIFYPLVFSPK